MTPNNASESSANELTDTVAPAGLPTAGAERAVPYLARILQLHLLADPDSPCWITEGTAVFADISGFTQLSEQLARKGREGAEQITDTIGGSFASILKVAYENGASLLKFGGDALLLWFQGDGHASARLRGRGAHARRTRRRRPNRAARRESHAADVAGRALGRVSISSRSARRTSRCCRPVPAWSRTVAMEHGGRTPARSSSARKPPRSSRANCVGRAKAPGVLLLARAARPRRKAAATSRGRRWRPRPLLRCLSPAIRAHVLAGGGTSEHRPVTIAFIRFEGTDALIEQARRGSGGRGAAPRGERRRGGHRGARRRVPRRPTSTPTAAS